MMFEDKNIFIILNNNFFLKIINNLFQIFIQSMSQIMKLRLVNYKYNNNII